MKRNFSQLGFYLHPLYPDLNPTTVSVSAAFPHFIQHWPRMCGCFSYSSVMYRKTSHEAWIWHRCAQTYSLDAQCKFELKLEHIHIRGVYLCLIFEMSIWKFITNSKKNQFRIKLDFFSSSNLIFTACVACKNQFRNQIDLKNSKNQFDFEIDFCRLHRQ